jgi:corrinoid protein of di/trimethylamine methyltransferase
MADKRFLEAMSQAIIDGSVDEARKLAHEALDEDVDPMEAIEQGFTPGMQIVGDGFAKGELFIPDLVMSGEAMKAAIEVLEPALQQQDQQRRVLGKVVVGTVAGDIHEIGKTLVATMLSANGFEVHDLGVDVPPSSFVKAVRETGSNLVGLSALLTTTLINQEVTIQALEEAGLREQVKVVVGGVPANDDWAEEIGADAYADNATDAVEVFKQLADT